MANYTVTLHGVPVARVELPAGRNWAGGRIAPLTGFGEIGPLLEVAAEAPSLAAALLDLPAGDSLPADAAATVPSRVATAYSELARLQFGLLDEAGLPTGAELVRVAPIGRAAGAVVRVYFRHAPGSVAARTAKAPNAGAGGLRIGDA